LNVAPSMILRKRLRCPILPDAMLHSTVYERFAAEGVQHFYEKKPYRPTNLAKHSKLSHFYATAEAPQEPLH
jgi:hypothetical protein